MFSHTNGPRDMFGHPIVDSNYIIEQIESNKKDDDGSDLSRFLDRLDREEDEKYGITRFKCGMIKGYFERLIDSIPQDSFYQVLVPVVKYTLLHNLEDLTQMIVEKTSSKSDDLSRAESQYFKRIYDKTLQEAGLLPSPSEGLGR